MYIYIYIHTHIYAYTYMYIHIHIPPLYNGVIFGEMLRPRAVVSKHQQRLTPQDGIFSDWIMASPGSFPKQGDPNIDPKILITGTSKKVPLILGNPYPAEDKGS